MDNKIAQEILSAYRADGQDAHDPVFREALAQCRNAAGMADWLERERAFDLLAADALEAIAVPQAGKRRLLETALRVDREQPSGDGTVRGVLRWFPSWMRAGIGMAALFVVGLLIWQVASRPLAPELTAPEFTMASLLNSGMPLSFRSADRKEVVAWLAQGGAPVPEAFPGRLADAGTLGCRVIDMPGGGQVSLICLLVNGEVIHYFVFDEQASELLAHTPVQTWWREAGWNLYSFAEGSNRIALATQGEPGGLL